MNKIKIDHYYKDESKTLRLDDVDYNIIPNSGIKPLLDKLQQENQQLKQWDINKDTRNSRQRVANKNLSRTFQKLKKDNNVITNNNIKLLKENNQLKDNWNKLTKQVVNRFNESQDVQFLDVLQDMQEIEQGSDNK